MSTITQSWSNAVYELHVRGLNPKMAPRLIDRYVHLTKMRKLARRHRKLRRFVRLVRSARVVDIGSQHHGLVMGLMEQAEIQIKVLAAKKVPAVKVKQTQKSVQQPVQQPVQRDVPTVTVMRHRRNRKVAL